MASRSRAILPITLVVLLFLLLYVGLFLNPRHESSDSPMIGKMSPEFDLPDLLQPGVRFSRADLNGQVSLVNIWATWCPSCRAEHDVLMRLAATKQIPIYSINWKDRIESGGSREAAIQWLGVLGDPYLKTGDDGDNVAGLEWAVTGAPETFLIDIEGRICERITGPLNDLRSPNPDNPQEVKNNVGNILKIAEKMRAADGRCLPRGT
ncbi:MAG: DsbE family thiol:disulfide interchange protein [Gammaproteobacteria bacterium]|jgi:cytochrome c biogenesis protein CcmG/thiol:disulfide interchange protein DsbE|nr:DsbE family thiol:disulfide interchange protein [Gammaproteobacteria bacterium]MBT4607935.1 DsbE family thiol:disulfide interchange protein [Thiotrichales bacterium]MBT3472269.1 DsbE family thiol:disulfide interchange protein [Gammaproteobacteria bacterium]MBT3966930.1 DsbE family thiol:disulfide interchange protein [Gammaproteobacteria bacterium]MBT4329058.1 DsbE family thiol:disulfide interchange protein [Gammaproteobacteria bacterium]